MNVKKIMSYDELDKVILSILQQKQKPLSANNIESILNENYNLNNLRVTPRKIGGRLRGHPKVKKISGRKHNMYVFFS